MVPNRWAGKDTIDHRIGLDPPVNFGSGS